VQTFVHHSREERKDSLKTKQNNKKGKITNERCVKKEEEWEGGKGARGRVNEVLELLCVCVCVCVCIGAVERGGSAFVSTDTGPGLPKLPTVSRLLGSPCKYNNITPSPDSTAESSATLLDDDDDNNTQRPVVITQTGGKTIDDIYNNNNKR
jgi:hypothetical protein